VTSAAADEAFEIADRLHSVAIHLLRRLRRVDSATGLPAPRLSALSVLVFGGPLTLTELAAAEQVRPPTMTRIIAALEAAELVEREGDPKDRRIVRVRATLRGIEVLEEGRRRRIGLLARELEALSPADRELLGRSLDTLEQVVGGRHWPARGSSVKAPGGGS
jgi:DNA-binding MarR family transcriptional regulator